KENRSSLLEGFANYRGTLDCTELWKERRRTFALATTASNCSEVVNQMLMADSQDLVASQSQDSNATHPTPSTI
ncbi:hypothetical protein DM01DRAFT_1269920, partial [Hesseltinella vesiculosa]